MIFWKLQQHCLFIFSWHSIGILVLFKQKVVNVLARIFAISHACFQDILPLEKHVHVRLCVLMFGSVVPSRDACSAVCKALANAAATTH